MVIPEVTVQELKQLKDQKADYILIDVREPSEYAVANIGGKLMPLGDLPNRLDELNTNQKIIVHCRSGGRSSRAVSFLLQNGFTKACNLKGGITAWKTEIDPSLPEF